MSLGLLGKKLGMTRLFDEESQAMIPVTVVEVGGNTILQTKTVEKDGYTAVQVGYNDQKEQRVTKPLNGHFKKNESAPKQLVQEFRFEDGAELAYDPVTHVLDAVLPPGATVTIVSTGGTPNMVNMDQLVGATEHRAGTCIFNDRMMMAAGMASLNDCALHVYTTVVSRGGAARGILDAGSKTLTSDAGGLDGYGLLLEYPDARIHKFAEEHGFLDLSDCDPRPAVGEIVRVVPNHVCVVVNMVDQLVAVRGDRVVDVIPVAARGRLV